MALLNIVRFPDKRLWTVAISVENIDQELTNLVSSMGVAMFANQGIGLSAVQIGVPLKFFIIEPRLLGGASADDPVVFINPEITWRGKETDLRIEGCLSLPDVEVRIRRPTKIKIEASALSTDRFELELEGEAARAVQHEYDHLKGRTIYHHANPSKQKRINAKLGEPPPWLKKKRKR